MRKGWRAAFIAVALLLSFFGLYELSRSRTVQVFGQIVPRVFTSRKVVALTFDDGPVAYSVSEILDILRSRRVKATFFMIGGDVEQNPGAAREVALAGHEIGNHSYSHVRMVFRSQHFYQEDFERTDRLLRAVGYQGPILVRAPYCKKLFGLPWYFAQHRRIHVTWDVEPESDPKIDGHTDRIVRDVTAHVRPGSIVLLHPWYRNRAATRAAIGPIIDALRAKGYTFATVSELMALK